MRRSLRATAAIAFIAALTACASGISDPENDGNTGAQGDEPFKLAFIMTNLGNPYNDSITDGLETAAEELGFDLTVVAPAEAGAADQVPFIQDQITLGVDAILINANDPAAVEPALEQAVAAGIEVFAINSDQIAEVRTTAFTPVDFSVVPADQLNLLADLLGGEGDFGILSATTTATFQKTVVDAQQALLEEDSAFAGLNLVQVAYGDDDPQKSATETLALTTAFPDLDAILSPTTVALAASAQAVESAGLGGEIVITGLGNPNQMRAFVESGTVERFQLWDPIRHGYVTGHFVVAILSGDVTGEPGSKIEIPDYGTFTVDPDGIVFTQSELTTFDADNIDDYDF